ALACQNYHDVNGPFPAGSGYQQVGNAWNYYDTWTISILPYIEHGNLFRQYDQSLPNATNASAGTAAVRTAMVKTYVCPPHRGSFAPAIPETGAGGAGGLARPLCMPGNYRCLAGRGWGGRGWAAERDGPT